VGRGLAWDQTAFGINGGSLWKWIHKRPSDETNALAAAPTAPVFTPALPFSALYVEFLYDRGHLANTGSVGELIDLTHSAHSIGVGVELAEMKVGNKKANLTVGYAFSPQSALHHRGAMFTSVAFAF
jgi:hypothetical protein